MENQFYEPKKTKSFKQGLIVGIIISMAVFLVFSFITRDKANEKIEKINKYIKENFLYLDKVNANNLKEGEIAGYVYGLGDPYSMYYNKEAYKELEEDVEGVFYGVGATFTQNPNTKTITIASTVKGSPAEEEGLKKGDILKKVDDKEVANKDLSEVISTVKGEENTKVKLTLVSKETGQEYIKTIKRVKLASTSVSGQMLEGNIGYIYIKEFDDHSYGQFKDTLKELKEKGMTKLVLDLRDNPGGNVDAVCNIADDLLPEGKILSVKDKDGNEQKISSDKNDDFNKPIVLLINGHSASSSEILAGAMQDYKKATLVGEKSYGKGVVQQIFSLGDGTALKLTVAEYYTPKGRAINKKGLSPDVKVTGEEAQIEKAIEILKSK